MKDFQDEMSNLLADRVTNEIENQFIEGLRRAGHEFEDDRDLKRFVLEHCTCLEHENAREYFARGKHFMTWYYSPLQMERQLNVQDFKDKFSLEISAGYIGFPKLED